MQQAESYIDGLVQSLWDEDETIRLRAIDELAKIGEPAVPAFLRALESERLGKEQLGPVDLFQDNHYTRSYSRE